MIRDVLRLHICPHIFHPVVESLMDPNTIKESFGGKKCQLFGLNSNKTLLSGDSLMFVVGQKTKELMAEIINDRKMFLCNQQVLSKKAKDLIITEDRRIFVSIKQFSRDFPPNYLSFET